MATKVLCCVSFRFHFERHGPGGSENQAEYSVRVLWQLLQHRQHKSSRLPTSSFCTSHTVTTWEKDVTTCCHVTTDPRHNRWTNLFYGNRKSLTKYYCEWRNCFIMFSWANHDANLPCRIAGTQFSWTGVALWIPSCLHCLISQSDRPSDEKSAILDVSYISHKLNNDFTILFNTEKVNKPPLQRLSKHPRGKLVAVLLRNICLLRGNQTNNVLLPSAGEH